MYKPRAIVEMWVLLAVVASVTLFAQDPVADVEVILTEPPPPITPPDSFGTFSFVLTNHGPDVAGDPAPAPTTTLIVTTHPALPFSEEFGRPILLDTAPDDDCSVQWGVPSPIPGNPPTVIYSVRFFGIEPGASARCDMSYYIRPHVVEDFDVTCDGICRPGGSALRRVRRPAKAPRRRAMRGTPCGSRRVPLTPTLSPVHRFRHGSSPCRGRGGQTGKIVLPSSE
jgi:hypothetical protein